MTELIQILCQTIIFFDLFNQKVELRDTPLSLTVEFIELGIYFAEEPHRLPLIDFGVINFFVDLGPFLVW